MQAAPAQGLALRAAAEGGRYGEDGHEAAGTVMRVGEKRPADDMGDGVCDSIGKASLAEGGGKGGRGTAWGKKRQRRNPGQQVYDLSGPDDMVGKTFEQILRDADASTSGFRRWVLDEVKDAKGTLKDLQEYLKANGQCHALCDDDTIYCGRPDRCRGRTFVSILNDPEERDFIQWCLTRPRTYGQLKNFVAYLKAKGVRRQPALLTWGGSDGHGLDGLLDRKTQEAHECGYLHHDYAEEEEGYYEGGEYHDEGEEEDDYEEDEEKDDYEEGEIHQAGEEEDGEEYECGNDEEDSEGNIHEDNAAAAAAGSSAGWEAIDGGLGFEVK